MFAPMSCEEVFCFVRENIEGFNFLDPITKKIEGLDIDIVIDSCVSEPFDGLWLTTHGSYTMRHREAIKRNFPGAFYQNTDTEAHDMHDLNIAAAGSDNADEIQALEAHMQNSKNSSDDNTATPVMDEASIAVGQSSDEQISDEQIITTDDLPVAPHFASLEEMPDEIDPPQPVSCANAPIQVDALAAFEANDAGILVDADRVLVIDDEVAQPASHDNTHVHAYVADTLPAKNVKKHGKEGKHPKHNKGQERTQDKPQAPRPPARPYVAPALASSPVLQALAARFNSALKRDGIEVINVSGAATTELGKKLNPSSNMLMSLSIADANPELPDTVIEINSLMGLSMWLTHDVPSIDQAATHLLQLSGTRLRNERKKDDMRFRRVSERDLPMLSEVLWTWLNSDAQEALRTQLIGNDLPFVSNYELTETKEVVNTPEGSWYLPMLNECVRTLKANAHDGGNRLPRFSFIDGYDKANKRPAFKKFRN